jgi:hypothetical protein
VWGALALLVWAVLYAVAWSALNWGDDRIFTLAGYLNSRFGAHARASMFTYAHLTSWLTWLEWALRYIVAPGLLLPFAAASAQWGLRPPGWRLLGFLFSPRWWLGVILAALVGVLLPGYFFTRLPAGSPNAQMWAVGIKLAAAYLLAITSWVILLAWWAVLFARRPEDPREEALVHEPVLAGPP